MFYEFFLCTSREHIGGERALRRDKIKERREMRNRIKVRNLNRNIQIFLLTNISDGDILNISKDDILGDDRFGK